ncbi:MucBP domain-containing protein, partial [Vagococcus sp.]|uniref:MucBP domain-containing protein n=1 Tax=Vagococcus sp. TaxID=1933889 RepID=UPI003F94DC13
GDSYTSKQKDIPGYTFKEVKGETSGVISNSTISIVYIYNANSAKLIIQFVDKNSLLPTNSINLLTYSDGSLIDNHPNISDYYYVRNIAGETERIEQNVPLEDIVYNVKMGDSIKVPSKISFDLYNEQGELLSKIDNGNPDYLHYSGFTDYRGELIPSDNTIVTEAVTIIKYAVTITPIAIPF